MFWHYARDDFMFTTVRIISKHQDTQVYGAILPQYLTNQAMLESKAYMTYYAYATGEKTLKPKSTKKKADSESSPKMKPTQASKGKRIKTLAKGDIPAKKKHDKEYDDEVNIGDDNDDDADNQDDDDDEEQDDVNEQTDSDNDGDDFVHPKLSTHDEEDNKEVDSDPWIHTPSNYESNDNEESDDEIQGENVEGEEMDEEETNEEDKSNEFYTDVNVNLQGRDTEMTDAPCTISSSVSSGFISNMLNPNPDTGIDFIFNLNTKSTSLIDVMVTTIVEPPLLSTTTLPPPPTPLITHLQQTPIPTPATAPSSSLQDLPNFGSLFGFDHRLKTLEINFSKLKKINQFVVAVFLIPDIVDGYLANKMHEAIKTVVQLQFEKLRDEAQAENEDFINKLDDNIKKIIKEQVKA
ncbi:hypothetical protein Tco_0837708 [Tanacetum coccineum]